MMLKAAIRGGFLALCLAWVSQAAKDSTVNRLRLADKYLEYNSIDDTIHELAMRHMASLKSNEDKHKFRMAMDRMDFDGLKETIRSSMVKHFNTEELDYMVETYATPIGKQVMAKMGQYSAEITPKIHNAIVMAAEKAMEASGQGTGNLESLDVNAASGPGDKKAKNFKK